MIEILGMSLGNDNTPMTKKGPFSCTLDDECKKTEFCSCRDATNNYGSSFLLSYIDGVAHVELGTLTIPMLLGLPCAVIGKFGEVPEQLTNYRGSGQCYHVRYMVKDFANISDPNNYVNLVGIVATKITAEEQCKNKSASSQITVDPEEDHSPWCQCAPMSHGDSSPWEDFNCTGSKLYFVFIFIFHECLTLLMYNILHISSFYFRLLPPRMYTLQ